MTGLDRDTHHAASVDLLLRFATANGPRTVMVPNLPLSDASAIAREMVIAGHHAEYFDHRGGKPMSTHIKELKRAARAKAAAASASTNVVPIKLSKKGKTHAGVHGGNRAEQ